MGRKRGYGDEQDSAEVAISAVWETMGSALENTPIQIYAISLKIFENSLLDKLRAKSISGGLGKFVYCLKNEQ